LPDDRIRIRFKSIGRKSGPRHKAKCYNPNCNENPNASAESHGVASLSPLNDKARIGFAGLKKAFSEGLELASNDLRHAFAAPGAVLEHAAACGRVRSAKQLLDVLPAPWRHGRRILISLD